MFLLILLRLLGWYKSCFGASNSFKCPNIIKKYNNIKALKLDCFEINVIISRGGLFRQCFTSLINCMSCFISCSYHSIKCIINTINK